MSEAELVTYCQRDNRRAQEKVYSLYSDRLYRLAFRYVRSQPDAEDVLLTAFTKVFSNIGQFQYLGDGSLEAWMRKIVVNESLMWLRRRHNFNLMENLEVWHPDPDLTNLSNLEAQDVYHFITALPDGYRTVFNLFVIEGYQHCEIAGMLAISENTSRSQLFKAKALLKKILTREGYRYGT